ncbi:MAG: YajQ family cyclic di-GMP-binding protein [Serratia symbiotica]|nr:YajQ family cyclic di-GMP-binding protein [Serratia symbiotica]
MPSFDIVSEIDIQEVRNAVENASRDLSTRWDFRNVPASFELNEKNESIKVASGSEFQVQQLLNILREKLSKRSIECSALEIPYELTHSGKTFSVDAKLKQGIDTIQARKIVKLIKDSKLRVQTHIHGDEVRVTGKSRDDLQSSMALVRGADLEQPFQFKNFRD